MLHRLQVTVYQKYKYFIKKVMINHLPTVKNYKLIARCYKIALSAWGKQVKADYMVEIIEYYYSLCSVEEKNRLRHSLSRFLDGRSQKRGYIEPYNFMAKVMEFYTLKTGKLKPDDWPELEEVMKY